MSRPKNEFRTASKECYDRFCENNPSITLSFEDYKQVLYTFNTTLILHLLETGDMVKLPYGLGELVINKYKPKRFKTLVDGREIVNLAVNWVETKKAGKYIYHLNAHTDGYRYFWMWNWWKTRTKCAYIWKLEMARVHSRLLKTYLKKANSKYKDLYREFTLSK